MQIIKNAEKKSEKVFSFWDKCIRIVRVELFLLRRKYLSSAVNVWIKNLQTWHVTKSDFFQLNSVHSD